MDTTAPADAGSDILTENNKMRDNWTDLNNNMNVDHYSAAFTVGGALGGEHRQVTLNELAVAPTGVAGKGFVYGYPDAVSSETEAFAKGKNNTPVQITRDGAIAGGGLIPVAWGYFDGSGVLIRGKNLSTGSNPSTGNYLVTIDANIVSDTSYFITGTPGLAISNKLSLAATPVSDVQLAVAISSTIGGAYTSAYFTVMIFDT